MFKKCLKAKAKSIFTMQPNKKTSSCLQELSCPQLQEKLSLEIMKDYWGLAMYGNTDESTIEPSFSTNRHPDAVGDSDKTVFIASI